MPDRQLATFSAGALLALTGVAVFGLVPPEGQGAWDLGVSALGMELFLAGLALGGASVSREPPAQRLGLGPGRLSPGAIALLALGTIALSHGIDGILQFTGLRDQGAIAEIDARLRGASGGALAMAIVGIGIAPGIAEELLCRGWIQRGLESRLGAPGAVAAATAVFGLLHGDVIHSTAAAGLGLYLGIIAWLAGSIRASILCHAANNLAAVLTLAWEIPTGLDSVWTLPVALVVAGGILVRVWRRAGPPPPPPAHPLSSGDSALRSPNE